MKKQQYLELSEYNLWANSTVCGWLEKINDQQWTQPLISSFSCIQETILHICGAQQTWFERMNGMSAGQWIPNTFKGTKDDHIDLLKKTSAQLNRFVNAFDENMLETGLFFKRLNGEENLMPYYQILLHVFNHSSFHRGQLVTMLRQVGFILLSSTDLSLFYKQLNQAALEI
jgi:uncharacterized damage-inducible protein DinB